MNDKSKLELIGEIAQANNKNLELIQEINQLQSQNNSLNSLVNSCQVEIRKLKGVIKECLDDISFCLNSITQEKISSRDSRTRQEMLSCEQILSERLKELSKEINND